MLSVTNLDSAYAAFVGLAVCLRVPVGVRLSSAALDLALNRTLRLDHLEELDKEVSGCAVSLFSWSLALERRRSLCTQ